MTTGPAPRNLRRRLRRMLAAGLDLAVGLFALLNWLCYRHARAFTHYTPGGQPPPKPEAMTLGRKLAACVNGVAVPRPENDSSPAAVGLGYATVAVPVDGGEHLDAWRIDHPAPRGAVVLGHGYMACKSSLLAEAAAFHRLGWAVLAIDFRGSGGSPRADTTLGVREGEDVAAAVRFAGAAWPGRPVVVFGASMGAAAALKAVAAHGAAPAAVILEAPFDRMVNAVRARFRAMSLPGWPAAGLVVFWGGRQVGFDGFAHNPAADAAAVTCPALVLFGSADDRATPDMVRAVAEALAGPARRVEFAGAGHESLLRFDRTAWEAEVGRFLDEFVPAN
jgi:alpha-beta hydrolase superfamily lysophospholipase